MLRKNRKRCGLLAGTLACAAAVSAVMLPMHCEAKTPVIGAKQVGVAYLQLNGNTVSFYAQPLYGRAEHAFV